MCCSQHLQNKMDLVEKKNKVRLPEKSKGCLIKRSMNLLRKFLENGLQKDRQRQQSVSRKRERKWNRGIKLVAMKFDINRKGKMG